MPELMHCGLGFNPAIKSYGLYDMEFLKRDILPNVTTLVVPSSIQLPQAVIDDWHRQGKRFIAEVGFNARCQDAPTSKSRTGPAFSTRSRFSTAS